VVVVACRLCGRKPALRTVWGALCGSCTIDVMGIGNVLGRMHFEVYIATERLGSFRGRVEGKAAAMLGYVTRTLQRVHSDALLALQQYRDFLKELEATAEEG